MSGRSSSSAVGPSKRISPFSMKYARWAIVRATFTDCSTTMIVVPASRMRSTICSSCPTTTGANPSDSSSIISRRGRSMNAIPRVSICCCPPERFPAGSSIRSRRIGKSSSTSSVAAFTRSLSRRWSQPARWRFSFTVSVGNTP